MTDIITNKDAPDELEFTQDGLTIKVSRKGEHHMLYLSIVDGELPEKYKGAYTTIEAATKDINQFFENRRIEMDKLLDEMLAKKKAKKETNSA